MSGTLHRRRFLSHALTGACAAGFARAQTRSTAKPHRVDFHHHFVPPRQAERILAAREGRPPRWTPEMSLEQMENNSVATSLISIVQPGIWFGNNEGARALARHCNEYGTQMAKDHPGRFGLLAALPLPDVEGSLREAAYAKVAPFSNVLFGSDYPFRPVSEAVDGLVKYEFTAAQRRAIDRDNTVRLLPRLKR